MTNTGAMPAGWYHAAGDPVGTQRYWDGAQWIGDPQPVPQPAPSAFVAPQAPGTGAAGYNAPGYGPPGSGAPGFGAPAYGAPPPGFGTPAPSGYVPFSNAAPYGAAAMQPAPIGKRIVAYVIDVAPIFLVLLLIVLAAIALGEASAAITIIGVLSLIPYGIWNFWWRRGSTGQSIGDSQQGIKLVKNDTGEPAGGWTVFGRYFVMGLISNFTCGIVGLLDILWPLWDDRNNRLGDKMFSMTVVVA